MALMLATHLDGADEPHPGSDTGPGAFAMIPGGDWLQQEHTASPFTSE